MKLSRIIITLLAAQGFKVVNMKGGYLAWTANGMEIEK
jgi:rhodanese-related sulfurtransferase